ncbi:hypothetical protein F5884DRAFT_828301 [Xylogone sp. PMI_703]|nr:hypothetical protein F5884DRAFT_828301 [Xylogone sp. PMI_703]
MQDPSFGVQRDLIPHVHLISTFRFPVLPNLHPDKVTEWLLNAPKIARDQSPFYWTYLDRPADGTVLLTWQSMNLGTDFASDGYIWSPGETAFQMEVAGGYTLEMYQHKTGYGPGEPIATHTRRRYRLLPPKFPVPSGSAPDPSFWIVHYGQCAPEDRVPANVIPIDQRIQNTMSTRAYLQQQGQIIHKEFMLHDRNNWPNVPFPSRPQVRQPMYGSGMTPVRTPQSMAYPTQATPGPPSKRARTQANAAQSHLPPPAAVPRIADDMDDEEDTSRGDIYDQITPREVSAMRYRQNHEWMDEVLSSPFSISQIMPVHLGLGLKGELNSLTEGFFDAEIGDPAKDVTKFNYVGRLDPGKAEEFRVRANNRIEQIGNEIEKMKALHEKRLKIFKKSALLVEAEKELRSAVHDPTNTGSEFWRLEGRIGEEDNDNVAGELPPKVDDILAKVEASLGRHATAVHELQRIQDGGYEEVQPIPSPKISPQPSQNGSQQSGQSGQSGVLIGDADIDMGGSAAGLLDQFHGVSSTSTPGNSFATPQAHLQGQSPAPSSLANVPSPNAAAGGTPQPSAPQSQAQQETSIAVEPTSQAPAAADANGTGDWVVVPPGGVSPEPSSAAQNTATPTTTTPQAPATTTQQATASLEAKVETPAAAADPSPAGSLPTFDSNANDFGDLEDLDTAGEALAGYNDHGLGGDEEMDLGLDMDVGMDDSAFGDAFHGVDTDTPNNDSAQGDGEGM